MWTSLNRTSLTQPSLLPLSKDDEELDEENGVLAEARGAEEIADEFLPDCGMEDGDVEQLNVPYTARGPLDWVSSGTLVEMETEPGRRPLRYFPTWDDAELWAREFFGTRFKGRIMDAVNSGTPRWAFLIQGPRGV